MITIRPFEFFLDEIKKISLKVPLVVNSNDLILVTGPSGSGKTTFLKYLKNLHQESLYLCQNPFDQVIMSTASQEFFLPMENATYSIDEMNRQKEIVINEFLLKNIFTKQTSHLSNGECQKLFLSSLFILNPSILILDEPLAFLDNLSKKLFMNYLNKIKGNFTIFIVEHNYEEVLEISNRQIWINNQGEITELKKLEFKSKTNFFIEKTSQLNFEWCLKIENVKFTYSNELLINANFEIKNNEIVILQGANGSGKSTLFQLIAKSLKPKNGKIQLLFNGISVKEKVYFKSLGFVFQNSDSNFYYDTIEEELGLNNANKTSINKSKIINLLNEFLPNVNLQSSPFLLSEGEKRRLSILLTLIDDKKIILMDEPTFGLDFDNVTKVIQLILNLKKSGVGIFIISHDDYFIDKVFDRKIDMENLK